MKSKNQGYLLCLCGRKLLDNDLQDLLVIVCAHGIVRMAARA